MFHVEHQRTAAWLTMTAGPIGSIRIAQYLRAYIRWRMCLGSRRL